MKNSIANLLTCKIYFVEFFNSLGTGQVTDIENDKLLFIDSCLII